MCGQHVGILVRMHIVQVPKVHTCLHMIQRNTFSEQGKIEVILNSNRKQVNRETYVECQNEKISATMIERGTYANRAGTVQ